LFENVSLFIFAQRNYTFILASDILSQVKHSNVKSVAERTGVVGNRNYVKGFKKRVGGSKTSKVKKILMKLVGEKDKAITVQY